MPFIIGAILMTQLKSFKGSTKKSVEEVIDVRNEIAEKGNVDFKERISKAQKKFEEEQELKNNSSSST